MVTIGQRNLLSDCFLCTFRSIGGVSQIKPEFDTEVTGGDMWSEASACLCNHR